MHVCGECGATRPAPGICEADGATLQPIGDDLLLGTTIGPYRVARLVGVGGMGRVYKAVHPAIGSRVAIKVLSRESSDRRDLVERFFGEAKTVNLIKHESIVNVLDLAVLSDGRPYIVMEHLDGSSLAAVIEDARRRGMMLPLGGIVRLIGEVLGGLGAAHAKGVIHRDLKPDNIFVTPQGRAKILDFGIAKLQPEFGGSSTQTGSLLGTPHYMSPEQAAGRPLDTRADIYAIGVILFECATLQRPFHAPALFDMLKMHIEMLPPSPRASRPDMPDGLENVILTALAKSPDGRFATAQAMAAALTNATSALPSEQWQPILPGANRPSSPAAWAPTPPASWAGGSSNTEIPAQGDPTRGGGPTEHSKLPDPELAHAPTQTAGQVSATPAAKPSRRGIWIALGGVALAGGGLAAGLLVAGGGGGSKQTSSTGSGSGSGPAVVEVPAADAAVVAEVPPDPGVGLAAGSAQMSPQDMAQMDALLDSYLAMAPVENLPPPLRDAIKKYGSWKAVPRAEKNKILAMGPALLAGMLGSNGLGGLGALGGGDPFQQVFDELDGKPPPDANPSGKAE